MTTINQLLDRLNILYDSDENKRRQSFWQQGIRPIRGETQWHGIPIGSARNGDAMPVTAECLNTIWTELLGFRLDTYYKDPEYYLEYYLRMKLKKFTEFPDDTPLDRNIPVSFGVIFEAGVLGQNYHFLIDQEPALSPDPAITPNTDLPTTFDFEHNSVIQMAKDFYVKLKDLVGPEFTVIFPQWFRGPQGVALYMRGFENFLSELYLNPIFSHRLMRYVTDAAKAYNHWLSDYLEQPIEKGDLFNDDLPIMSPASYREFILPYEKELSEFYGGIAYWHSCGNITKHVPEVVKVPDIEVLDFGVTMDDKRAALEKLPNSFNSTIELRVMAQKHIQNATDEEMRAYMEEIVACCREMELEKYVLRSSGMSVLLGAEDDLKQLRKWVEVTRRVQE
jgi:uroporphyrinogen-III decarboxylase